MKRAAKAKSRKTSRPATGVKREFEHALEDLIVGLYGKASKSFGMTKKAVDGALSATDCAVPKVLKAFHARLGKHDRLLGGGNRILKPSKLYLLDNHLVFAEENQNVVLWGVPLSKSAMDDPPVFAGNHDWDEWYPQCKHLSLFLLRMTCWQSINGVFKYTDQATLEVGNLSWVSRKATAVSYPRNDPNMDMRAWYRDGVAICAYGTPGQYTLLVGSNNKRMLSSVSREIGILFEE